MFLIHVILATINAIIIFLYIKWRHMKTFWSKKGIPQCPIHPIFGSLTFLQKINPTLWFLNIYKHYPFPYIGIWVFWRPGLIVNSPEIAHKILVTDSDKFRNRLLGTGKKDELGCNNLFTINDPLWTTLRKDLSSTFTPSKLRSWQDLYSNKAEDLIIRLKSDNEKGIKNNLKSLFADFATDIIGESAFGIKCEATKNSTGPLREMTKEFEKFSSYRGLQWFLIFFFPELADFLGHTFWPKKSMLYFRKLFSQMVKERGGYEKKIDWNRDLMDALIEMKQKAMRRNQDLDEIILISNALIFLQGGYETTSTMLAYTVYELAFQAQYQEIVHKELMEVKTRTGSNQFQVKDLAELPYLNAIVKESLRKYLIMGWLDRIATQNYKIDENLVIPAGTAILINVNGIHHDPKYFPDPEQFKPERFLPENEKNIVPYTYLPFGEGPRFCIGKRFGLNSVRHALAAMIFNFKFKPLPNMPPPNEVPIDKKTIFIHPGQVLSVEFVSRN